VGEVISVQDNLLFYFQTFQQDTMELVTNKRRDELKKYLPTVVTDLTIAFLPNYVTSQLPNANRNYVVVIQHTWLEPEAARELNAFCKKIAINLNVQSARSVTIVTDELSSTKTVLFLYFDVYPHEENYHLDEETDCFLPVKGGEMVEVLSVFMNSEVDGVMKVTLNELSDEMFARQYVGYIGHDYRKRFEHYACNGKYESLPERSNVTFIQKYWKERRSLMNCSLNQSCECERSE
jgi:hypothetical protein